MEPPDKDRLVHVHGGDIRSLHDIRALSKVSSSSDVRRGEIDVALIGCYYSDKSLPWQPCAVRYRKWTMTRIVPQQQLFTTHHPRVRLGEGMGGSNVGSLVSFCVNILRLHALQREKGFAPRVCWAYTVNQKIAGPSCLACP